MGGQQHTRELKERAYALTLGGFRTSDVAYVLGVGERSVRRWAANARLYGDVERTSALRGRPPKINAGILKELRALIRSSPSLYLDEVSTWLAFHHDLPVSISTVHRSLVAQGFTYKKLRKTATERDEQTRAQWKADITSRFTASQLIFADESSKDNRTSYRHYGRAMAGQRAVEVLSFDRGVRYSILPALSIDGILTVRVVQGSVNGVEFYDWVVTDLVCTMNSCIVVFGFKCFREDPEDESVPWSKQCPHHRQLSHTQEQGC